MKEIREYESISELLRNTPKVQCPICKRSFYFFCLVPEHGGLHQFVVDEDVTCPECANATEEH